MRANLRHVLTGVTSERVVDYVVVEHGLSPMESLYHDLKPSAINLGQVDHTSLIRGEYPFLDINQAGREINQTGREINQTGREINQTGKFYLARIGDAVAGRNMHAAILDALRICHTV